MLRQILLELQAAEQFKDLRVDLSALHLSPNGYLWLASDEQSSLERLRWDGGKFTDHHSFSLHDFFDLPSKKGELDIEGISSEGHYLWVTGSHSRKLRKPNRDSLKDNLERLSWDRVRTEPNRYLLGRIPLVDGELTKEAAHPDKPKKKLTAAMMKIADDRNDLIKALRNDPHIGGYVKAGIPGKANGIDIEGLLALENRILLGLRGPVLLDQAILIEIELRERKDSTLALKKIGEDKQSYRKHFINLQGLGARDLCLFGDHLLILAGPTQYLDGPAHVFQLPLSDLAEEKLHKPTRLFEIPCGVGTDHPEGITLATDLTGEPSVFVVYDGPGPDRLSDPNHVLGDLFALPLFDSVPPAVAMSEGGGGGQPIISHRAVLRSLSSVESAAVAATIGLEGSEEAPVNPVYDAIREAFTSEGENPDDATEMVSLLSEALSLLEEAEADPQVLTTVQHPLASALQSFLAERAEERNAQPGMEVTFDDDDILGWVGSFFTWWRRLFKHDWISPPAPEPMADTVRIGILGDWGTGLYGAPICKRSIENDSNGFQILLHLGDVYYSGTEKEVRENFLRHWPRVPGSVSRACNSNHEMYSGGYGYFDVTLPDFGQSSSCFAFQNGHWLLVGLDSGYKDHDLAENQVPWLEGLIESAGSRKVVLFCHHQPFSLMESQGTKLVNKLQSLLINQKIFAWYWGHEHRCVLYDRHPLWRLHGRCIGHSGYPYFREVPGDAHREVSGNGFNWHRLRGKNLIPGGLLLDGANPHVQGQEQRYGVQGYAVLELNGSQLVEQMYNADGQLLRTATLT